MKPTLPPAASVPRLPVGNVVNPGVEPVSVTNGRPVIADHIQYRTNPVLSEKEHLRRLRTPLVVKLAAEQFLREHGMSDSSKVVRHLRSVSQPQDNFGVRFAAVKSLGQNVYDSALSGQFLADASKDFAESLKKLIPKYSADWGKQAYAGELDFVNDILPEYRKCQALREFAYVGVQSLIQLECDRQALVTAEYKAFSEWMNFYSNLSALAGVLAKKSPDMLVGELNDFIQKFEMQIRDRGEITNDALIEEQTLLNHLRTTKTVLAVESVHIDVDSFIKSIRQTADDAKRDIATLLKKHGNETRRKAINDMIVVFAKTIEDCFPLIFSYEQALLTWTALNARRASEMFGDTSDQIQFATGYFEAAGAADVRQFQNLPHGIRLTKTLQMVKHRALLRNGIELPDHLKEWFRKQGVAPDQMAVLPLDDRTPSGLADDSLIQADASFRNIDPKPMRFYVPGLQTAIMWLSPDHVYRDTDETPFDWNQNPWNFILQSDDKGLIVFGHGTSAEYSNSNAVLAAAEAMAYVDETGVGRKRHFGVLMYDQIEHGFGPLYRNQEEPQNYRSYRRQVLEFGVEIARADGKGAVTMGRSFSANESLDAPLLNGDLFAEGAGYLGAAAMSPYLEKWVAYTMQSLVEHQVVLNHRGDNWSSRVEPHWMFQQPRDPSDPVSSPTLITYSPDDIEYPPEVLDHWKSQFGSEPGYLIASFPGGYHDLFNRNDPFTEQKEGDPFIAHAARRLYQWYWNEVFSGQKPNVFPEALRQELAAVLEARTRQAFIMGLLHDTAPTEDAARNTKMANRIHRRQLIEVPVTLRDGYFDALRQFARGKLSLIIQSTSDTSGGKEQKKKRSASDLASQIQELRNTVRSRICQHLKSRFFHANYEEAQWINLEIPAEILDFLWAHLPKNMVPRFPEALAIEESGRFVDVPRLSGRDFDALLDGKYHKSINREFFDRFVAFVESAVSELLEASLRQTDVDQMNPVAADLAIMTESLAKSFAPVVFTKGMDRNEFEMLKQDPRIQMLWRMLQEHLDAETVVINGSILVFGREVPRMK